MSNAAAVTAMREVYAAFGVDPDRVDDATKRVIWDAMTKVFRAYGWKPPADSEPKPSTRSAGTGPAVFPPFGRSKGTPIKGAAIDTLRFYERCARENLDNPAKARWHANEQALLDAVRAELRAQGQAADHGD